MTVSCSDVCDVVIARLKKLGFEIPDNGDDDAHEVILESLKKVRMAEGPPDDSELYCWTEEDLAAKYASETCPDCQKGECENGTFDHDLSIYWNLPATQRERMAKRARKLLFDNDHVGEAIHDTLLEVVQKEVGP